jgi:hypothetical protein
MFFANANTLYVCDEGDGVLLSPPVNGSCGRSEPGTALNIGVPYSVPDYPASLDPATDGCRDMTGRVNPDGKVFCAVTSTIGGNGDQDADPNKLVRLTDILNATTLPTGGFISHFFTLGARR